MRFAALLVLLVLGAPAAQAQRVGSYGRAPTAPAREPNFDAIGIDERLGEVLDLSLEFRDEHGKPITLGSCIGGKPTILVLAYYECPMLCNQVLNGVVEAIRALPGDVGKDFNVVTVSFDPKDIPGIAYKKKLNYLEQYGRPGADKGWSFLTGRKESIDALCQKVGFRYEYDAKKKQYNHASGILVVTPFGKISKYFFGIDYQDPKKDVADPASYKQLAAAIEDAAEGRTGSKAPPNRIIKMLCYEYNPITGEYTFTVMIILRIVFGTLVFFLGIWLIRNWRRPTKLKPDEAVLVTDGKHE
jgi:protein SCO1